MVIKYRVLTQIFVGATQKHVLCYFVGCHIVFCENIYFFLLPVYVKPNKLLPIFNR